MHQRLILVGGGELARVIIETVHATQPGRVLGFVDPLPCDETVTRLGVPRLGGDEALARYPEAQLVLGVGSIKVAPVREKIVRAIAAPADRWAAVIHPTANVSATASIGEGAVILAASVVCSGARIGRHAIINIGVMIDHDVQVGAFVHVAPRSALGGGSFVGDNAYIGMGASLRDHTRVNERTMVGMGAVVAKEFPADSVLIGIPARAMAAVQPPLVPSS